MNFKENESATKLRGGYYTDLDIAVLLTRWVLKISPKSILEPSCGDGIFLEALSHLDHKSVTSFTALEIEPSEAAKSQERARKLKDMDVDIKIEDFLKWSLYRFGKDQKFDAVVGNPPFIRYQYMDSVLQGRSQKIFEYHRLHFTKHTNLWVPFIVASISLLRPGGRLAMVVPAEILHVIHAQSLRKFLTEQCSKVLFFDPTELLFENILQGAGLLLAEKKLDSDDKFHGVAIVPTRTRSFLGENPETYFIKSDFVNGKILTGKWMKALLTKRERDILKGLSQNPKIFQFDKIANVDVGIVTGANNFFLVPDETVEKYGLKRWAYPMFGRSSHAPGIIYDRKNHEDNRESGLPTNFLWFDSERIENFPESVKEYIKKGESEDLPKRYKCRIREPWYAVPSVYASPVGMLKRCHDFPRLILNEILAFTTDTAYRIKANKIDDSKLVFSFINSLTALYAELEGRHYGGGVLEMVPSEIEKLLIPLPEIIRFDIKQLDKKIRNGAPVEEIFEAQNDILLGSIGLKNNSQADLYSAWDRLRLRRQREKAGKN
jgi:adenine-specific DNA-methyltransferase